MAIIDYTYFKGKILLPQVGNTDGRTEVESFIETYETEYLKKVLGYDLWKAFDDGISGSGTPDQRWIDLLQGKEFTYIGRNNAWPGFEIDEQNPIAYYIFYQYMNRPLNTLVGTAVQNVDNNSKISPSPLMIMAWNSMVDQNKLLWMFLKANSDTYPEWQQVNWAYNWWDWSWWADENNCWMLSELYRKKNSFDI